MSERKRYQLATLPEPGAVASIFDVAKAAGVGTSTVSRVLNGHPSVRPATSLRVREAMQTLGYRPNAMARGLVAGRSHTLGLALYALHNPFFGLLAEGIATAARARGYDVLITLSDESHRGEMLTTLVERRVDGVFLAPIHLEDELAEIRKAGMKAVVLSTADREGVGTADRLISFVGTDNVRGGYLATRHLIDLGHRRISFLGYDRNNLAGRDRLQGYMHAHQDRNIALDPALILQDLLSMEDARGAARRLLIAPQPPTAIFAVNDEFAIAAFQATTDLGRRVPDEVALVGFDDIPFAACLPVPLTTVALPIAEIGRVATNLLIDQIEHPDHPAQHVMIQSELIVRGSCGAYPGSESDPDAL